MGITEKCVTQTQVDSQHHSAVVVSGADTIEIRANRTVFRVDAAQAQEASEFFARVAEPLSAELGRG